MDSIKRHTGLMTLPNCEVSWLSVFDARGGLEWPGDSCGGTTAVVGPSDAGEAAAEGGGGLSEPGDSSMEDCSWTHEVVRTSSQSSTLESEPARDGSTVATAVSNPNISGMCQ